MVFSAARCLCRWLSLYVGCTLLVMGFVGSPAQAQTTARTGFEAVEQQADALAPGASFIGSVVSGLDPESGAAPLWLYLFQIPEDGRIVGVIKTDGGTQPAGLRLPPALVTNDQLRAAPISEDWLDSDEIMEAAEQAGGADFRASVPDAVLSGYVLALPEGDLFGEAFGSLPLFKTFWLVNYTSLQTTSAALFLADAQTGFTLPLEQVLARDALDVAETVAAERLAPDAYLVDVSTLIPDLSPGGQSALWSYTYYAPSVDSARTYVLGLRGLLDGVIEIESPTTFSAPLPSTWIESDEAANVALDMLDERGQAVSERPAYAQLRTDASTGRALWSVGFISVVDGDVETVTVDAATGQPVAVDEPAAEQPRVADLLNTYPNPLQAQARTPYVVNEPGPVRLALYDVLGRKVRTLVEAVQAPGAHAVTWTALDAAGRALPSGVYLLRLESGGTTQVRLVTLLR